MPQSVGVCYYFADIAVVVVAVADAIVVVTIAAI